MRPPASAAAVYATCTLLRSALTPSVVPPNSSSCLSQCDSWRSLVNAHVVSVNSIYGQSSLVPRPETARPGNEATVSGSYNVNLAPPPLYPT